MTRTEAAEIIANHAHVLARRYRWTGRITALQIGQVIGEMRYQSDPGSRLHQAAVVRPADQTIRRAGRRIQTPR